MVRLGSCVFCACVFSLRSGLVLKEINEDHTLLFASLEKKVYSPIAHREMNARQGGKDGGRQ